MSSMFKKKGGLAFKPKIPSTRPRAPTTREATTVTDHVADDEIVDTTPKQATAADPTTTPLTQDQSPETSRTTRSRRRSSVASTSNRAEPLPRQTRRASVAIESDADEAEAETSEALVPAKRQTRSERRTSVSKPTPPAADLAPEEAAVLQLSNVVGIATPPPTQPRATRRRASVAVETAEEVPARPNKRVRANATATGTTQTAPPAADRRKRGSVAVATNGDAAKGKAPRRARSVTPEDSEAQVVDLQKLKMSDLTKDLHIGKKFSRHDELRDRERQARIRAKLERGESIDGLSRSSTPLADQKKPGGAAASSSSTAGPSGPQFRIVDGQIVVDQSSLVMDRHARAAAAQTDMETIEENDFTRLITSSSFMNTSKLKGPNIWTDLETEMFYKGLRMLGTDFEMIAHMIPGKQRRHVKLKFNREERHNSHRVTAALVGEKTEKIDIDAYQAATGAEFEAIEAIEAEQRKVQESYEAEQQRVVDEQAEIMEKRREELFADEDADKGKKKGKRKGKQSVQYGLNGQPIG